MDDEWRSNYLWEKMQKRVDQLERKVFYLEKWQGEQKEKQIQEYLMIKYLTKSLFDLVLAK